MGSDSLSEDGPERRFRTLFISDVHLGTRGCQADRCWTSCAPRRRDDLPGRRYRRWLGAARRLVLAAAAQRRRAEAAAQGAQGRTHHLCAGQSRRSPARLLRHPFRRHRGGGEQPCTRAPTASAISSFMATCSIWSCRTRAGSPISATRPMISPSASIASFNGVRRRLGFPYWSLSQWAKLKVKNAVNYIGAFEKTLAAEARASRADGVICGHIHHAAIHEDFGVRYLNCGDWVESCTGDRRAQGRPVRDHHLDRSAATSTGAPRLGGARRMPQILVATDAWHPQVNGVVRSLTAMAAAAKGVAVEGASCRPNGFAFCHAVLSPSRLALPFRQRSHH